MSLTTSGRQETENNMSKNYEAAEIVDLGQAEELVLGITGAPGDNPTGDPDHQD
jgi:hypothetical protein